MDSNLLKQIIVYLELVIPNRHKEINEVGLI